MAIKETLSKIAAWFQPTYKKIDEWDLPWLRDLCGGIWDILDDDIKKSLYAFVMAVNKKSPEVAKEIMEFLKEKASKIVDDILGK